MQNEIDADLEYNYNNMARRPDAPELLQSWSERSARYRAEADSSLDNAYGGHERELIDVFRSRDAHAPLLVYIHGGYWQRGDKSIYSFIAEAWNAAGVDVAIIGYPLCPQVSMTRINESIRNALAWIYTNAGSIGVNRDRINLSGHSAGGHLTAMCLCADWPGIAAGLPCDLVKTAVPISGLYRLAPLLPTSISDALSLDDDEIEALSPVTLTPACTAPLLVVVGGAETPAFFNQADDLLEAWSSPQRAIERYDEPDVDHFDVVARLASADSELFRRVYARIS